jgi:hypothetical protein
MGRPWVRQSEDDAVASAVSTFGAELKPRLQGPGEPEDQLRAPTEALVKSIAQVLGVDAVLIARSDWPISGHGRTIRSM